MFEFLASTNGRILRILIGVILILVGLLAIQGTVGYIVAIIGVVPLLAGLFDVCIFAPLFGKPLRGTELRKKES